MDPGKAPQPTNSNFGCQFSNRDGMIVSRTRTTQQKSLTLDKSITLEQQNFHFDFLKIEFTKRFSLSIESGHRRKISKLCCSGCRIRISYHNLAMDISVARWRARNLRQIKRADRYLTKYLPTEYKALQCLNLKLQTSV